MPQSMAVIALVSEPMWKRSAAAILSDFPRVRTPATPRATVSPLRTTAAAMPGTSYSWMTGVRSAETSLDGGAAAWIVMGMRQRRARAMAKMSFIAWLLIGGGLTIAHWSRSGAQRRIP